MSHKLLIEIDEVMHLIAGAGDALLVDVTTKESYAEQHIPGAIYVDYRHLVSGIAPSPGTLPDIEQLCKTLAHLGISKGKSVFAYDNEGGGKASRFLWTLDVLGFDNIHLINGGLNAWQQSGLELESAPNTATSTDIEIHRYNSEKLADKGYILDNLENGSMVIWDARTPAEYSGLKARALRNGHIPGAINLNWLDTIDHANALRYRSEDELLTLLKDKGITPDKTIVPHCHTHHRSAHSAILLKHLGYPSVRAYPGSWSEWGNSTDTPIVS